MWEARKYLRRGLKNPPAALYEVADAQKATTLFQTVDYHKVFEPAPGIRVMYYDAGHILGSGSLRLEADEDGKTTSLIFSGDIGRPQSLIVRNPETPPKADYVFMAEALQGEVINADSRQVYADFPLITAQPSPEERACCPHHLYGFLAAEKKISAGRWAEAAAAMNVGRPKNTDCTTCHKARP